MPTKTNRISLYRLRDPKQPNHLEPLNAGYELISESSEQKLFVKSAHQSIPTWRTFISEQLAQVAEREKSGLNRIDPAASRAFWRTAKLHDKSPIVKL